MHAPTDDAPFAHEVRSTDPRQLLLFGRPGRPVRRHGLLTAVVLSAAGAFALVYAVRTFMQGSTAIRGDVLDDDRFVERSPAHAGYDA